MTSDVDKTTGLQADDALLISVLSKSVNVAGESDLDEMCRAIIELAMELIPCAAADLAHNLRGGSMQMTASSDPVISAQASPAGISRLTFRLPMGSDSYGVLRFHFTGTQPDDADHRLASAFAGHVAMALDRVALRGQVSHLLTALDTNREIGAAIGVLMAGRGVDYDDAFALLRNESQRANKKLRLVASDVLYTGSLPDPGASPRRTSAAPVRAKAPRRFASVAVAPEVADPLEVAALQEVADGSDAVRIGEHDDRFAGT